MVALVRFAGCGDEMDSKPDEETDNPAYQRVAVGSPDESSTALGELAVEIDNVDEVEWHEIVRGFQDANLFQTWPYAAERWGAKRLSHLVVRRNGRPVAAAQVILVRVPLTGAGLAYVKWGPLWQAQGNDNCSDVLEGILLALRHEYVLKRGLFLRISPWEFDGDVHAAYREAGFRLDPSAERVRTAVLDLSYPLADLRASLTRHWRHNLKVAEKNDLVISEGCAEDLVRDFSDLYRQMRRRKQSAEIPNIDYLPAVQKRLPDDMKVRIAICRYQGNPVAGLVVSAMGPKAFALFAATGIAGLDARGSYLLQWRMLEWLKQQNVRSYDLVRINETTHPGTTQFKLGLCGKLGRTVEYAGDFEACERWASERVVRAGERMRDLHLRLRAAMIGGRDGRSPLGV